MHQLMDVPAVYLYWLLQHHGIRVFLRTFVFNSLGRMHLEVPFLGHIIIPWLTFPGNCQTVFCILHSRQQFIRV